MLFILVKNRSNKMFIYTFENLYSDFIKADPLVWWQVPSKENSFKIEFITTPIEGNHLKERFKKWIWLGPYGYKTLLQKVEDCYQDALAEVWSTSSDLANRMSKKGQKIRPEEIKEFIQLRGQHSSLQKKKFAIIDKIDERFFQNFQGIKNKIYYTSYQLFRVVLLIPSVVKNLSSPKENYHQMFVKPIPEHELLHDYFNQELPSDLNSKFEIWSHNSYKIYFKIAFPSVCFSLQEDDFLVSELTCDLFLKRKECSSETTLNASQSCFINNENPNENSEDRKVRNFFLSIIKKWADLQKATFAYEELKPSQPKMGTYHNENKLEAIHQFNQKTIVDFWGNCFEKQPELSELIINLAQLKTALQEFSEKKE